MLAPGLLPAELRALPVRPQLPQQPGARERPRIPGQIWPPNVCISCAARARETPNSCSMSRRVSSSRSSSSSCRMASGMASSHCGLAGTGRAFRLQLLLRVRVGEEVGHARLSLCRLVDGRTECKLAGGARETPIKDVMHRYSGDVVGSFTVTSSASPSTSSKFCRGIAVPNHRRPRPDPHRVERQASRPGPAPSRSPRRTPRTRRRAGRPGCASDPCSPLIRHQRPRTRIAHHLPRPIRRVPHQPAGPAPAWQSVVERSRIEPPQVPDP